MAFIDKLKEELDRAGRVAQGAIDEGKTRIEGFRTRQLADKAAEALGYAVFRARQAGGDIEADTYTRLSATLATHDAEAAKYEAEIEAKRTHRADASTSSGSASTGSASTAGATGAATPPSSSQTPGGPAGPGPQDVSG